MNSLFTTVLTSSRMPKSKLTTFNDNNINSVYIMEMLFRWGNATLKGCTEAVCDKHWLSFWVFSTLFGIKVSILGSFSGFRRSGGKSLLEKFLWVSFDCKLTNPLAVLFSPLHLRKQLINRWDGSTQDLAWPIDIAEVSKLRWKFLFLKNSWEKSLRAGYCPGWSQEFV